MSSLGQRCVAAGASFVLSSGVGLATNVFTSSWAWTWGLALAVLLVLGVGSQVWLTVADGRRAPGVRVRASGAGSVAVGGSIRGPITTVVSGVDGGSGASAAKGVEVSGEGVVEANGPGTIAVGGDTKGPINMRVQRVDGDAVN